MALALCLDGSRRGAPQRDPVLPPGHCRQRRGSLAGTGAPFCLGKQPRVPRPLTESWAGPSLIPGVLLPSSGGWRREAKPLRFCPALSTGTGSICSAYILATPCQKPISPEPGIWALPPGNHLSWPNSSSEHHPSCPCSAQQPFSCSPNGPAQHRRTTGTLPAPCPGRQCPSTSLLPRGRQGKNGAPGLNTSQPCNTQLKTACPTSHSSGGPRGCLSGLWTCREPLLHTHTSDIPSAAVTHLLAGGWQ